jgi:hypothetical protein
MSTSPRSLSTLTVTTQLERTIAAPIAKKQAGRTARLASATRGFEPKLVARHNHPKSDKKQSPAPNIGCSKSASFATILEESRVICWSSLS